MSAPAAYDLNEIFDALASVWSGELSGDELGGQAIQIIAEPEVAGDIQTPAVVLELDDITYDVNMGSGADSITILATALVATADDRTAQRQLRSFLSRKPTTGVARLKTLLDAEATLGGLVSYAQMGSLRRFGRITFDEVDYLGAELVIEVMT